MASNGFNQTGQLVNSSQYPTLAAADVVAVTLGYGLNIDKSYTLLSNTSLNSSPVIFSGSVITLGAFNLTFNNLNTVVAPFTQIFNYNSTGVVLGTIKATGLPVEWWGAFSNNTNGTATRQALQFACNFTQNGSNTIPNATIWMLGQTYLFDGTGVTVSGVLMPNIVGSGTSPSSTRIVFSPSAGAGAIEFHGSSAGAPCEGGVRGIYFLGNINTTAVILQNSSFCTIDIGVDSSVGTGVLLFNGASGEFTESCNINLNIPTLGSSSWAVRFAVSGGNNSFANTKISGTISTGTGIRTIGIIATDANSWWYGGELNVTVNNTNGGGTANLISNQQSSGAPMWIVGGAIHLESGDAEPINIVDPAHQPVYFGGTVFTQGTGNVSLKNLIFAKTFNNTSTGVVVINDSRSYNTTQTFTGNTGVLLSPPTGIQNFATYYCNIVNSDNSYNYQLKFEVVQNSSGPAGGTVGSILTDAVIDTHSYGIPVPSSSTPHNVAITNSSWPSGTFTITYTVVTP